MTRQKTMNPGEPWRLRGPIPQSPAPGGEVAGPAGAAAAGGAVAKPDANHAAAPPAPLAPLGAGVDLERKKAEDAAFEARVAAAVKAELERAEAARKANEEAQKKQAEEEAKRAVQTPDQRRLDDFETQLEKRGKTIDEKTSALEAKLERQRERAVISALRKLGAREDIADADLLILAPKVDPDEPAGLAALAKWRTEKTGFFHKAKVGPQETIDTYRKAVVDNPKLTERQKQQRIAMHERLVGKAGEP